MIEKILDSKNIDALYITNRSNIFYLTNFTGSFGSLLITSDKMYLITDGRYLTQSEMETPHSIKKIIITNKEDTTKELKKLLDSSDVLGIEANDISIANFSLLKKELSDYKVKPINDIVGKFRQIKKEDEIKNIKEAVKITDMAFDDLLTENLVGKTELEVKNLIEGKMFELGAEGIAFESIIASGENAAKPHARPGHRVISKGDILTIDTGCVVNGYNSDMTRTFFIGKPKRKKLVKVHHIVREAMDLQITAIKPGVSTKEIDRIGRDYIESAGYGDKFVHGTGHGLGIDVHEAPYLNQNVDSKLKAGMVITIEPGIYIQDMGGVRIEQDVLVTKEGHEVLNKTQTSYNIYND